MYDAIGMLQIGCYNLFFVYSLCRMLLRAWIDFFVCIPQTWCTDLWYPPSS